MKINNYNIDKENVRLGAVVIGVGVIVEEDGVAVTHEFHVELPTETANVVQEILQDHLGSINSILKIKAGVPLKDQEKKVHHRELEGVPLLSDNKR